DLVRIDVHPVERGYNPFVLSKGLHRECLQSSCDYEALSNRSSQVRISTKCPAIAAAAAISGLTKWVRPPFPCRPSKLRLDVEAHRSPGCRMSGFMPRHMLQPDSRHSKPAALKILSRP